VQPDYGLFSAGYLNQYQHPAPEVVARFSALGIRTLNTADAGALELIAEPGRACRIRAWRSTKKRYWSAG
jgi:competence protein ComEC